MSKSSSKTAKANLKLRLKESQNDKLSDEDVDTLIGCEFAKVGNYLDLMRLMETVHGVLQISLGSDAMITL